MRRFLRDAIFGDLKQLSLSNRLMCLMSFWGLVFCVLSTTVNASLYLGESLAIVSGSVGIVFSLFYYLVRFKRKYEVVKWLFLFTCLAAMTYTWIHNGGYDSSNLYIYFNIFMIFIIISYPKDLAVLVAIFFVNISALYFLQYFYPNAIVPYESAETRFLDIYLTFAYNFFITFFLIVYVIKNYTIEKDNADEKNDKIEKMLDEITVQKSRLEDFNERLLREQNLVNQRNAELDSLNFDLQRKNDEIEERLKQINELNLDLESKNNKINKQKDELELNERKLIEAINTKNKFFSIIAHDIKNPLTALVSSGYILKRYFELEQWEPLKSHINKVEEISTHTYELLETLLEWSRSQTNAIQCKPEKSNILDIVNAAMSFYSLAAEQKNIKFEVNIQESFIVFCDNNMTTAIVRNLINNAIKFTNNNGKIIISAEIFSEDNQFALIKVQDNGLGMSDENIGQLFRIDVNIRAFGPKGSKGAGLGLILCKEFTERQSGKIWVESKLGVGSTFIFTLPLTVGEF